MPLDKSLILILACATCKPAQNKGCGTLPYKVEHCYTRLFKEPPQNCQCQKHDMKQVPH